MGENIAKPWGFEHQPGQGAGSGLGGAGKEQRLGSAVQRTVRLEGLWGECVL